MAVKKRLMVNRKQEAALKLKKNAVNMKAKNKTGKAMDARLKINAIARKKTLSTLKASGDARDVLAHKMKQVGDARAILEKSRNLKKGINEIKTTKKGGIQIVTKTNGKLQLTTKKKVAQQKKKTPTTAKNVTSAKVTKIGKNLTKSVGPGGTVSFSTKPKPSALSTPSARNNTSAATNRRPAKSAPRTASRPMSRAERRDEELMNAHVDPLIIKRTVRQDVRSRSPQPHQRYRSRSRSPIGRGYDDEYSRPIVSRARYDYDDPRIEARKEALYRQKIREEEEARRQQEYIPRTLAESVSSRPAFNGVKLQVSNLVQSVTQEDLSELFGDIGALKRVRMPNPGQAEVIFCNKEDAERAIDVYHNRQLDGKPMKCSLVTGGAPLKPSGSRLPPSDSRSRRRVEDDYEDERESRGRPDLTSIHKALFSERKSSAPSSMPFASSSTSSSGASRQKFTVVMPKGRPGNRRR